MGLSVIIITKNEARDLPRAIASVYFADEVIVLDSGSIDGTQQIARDLGAKVFETEDWPGFGPQKNRALKHANCEWILSLDADECIEQKLADEIQGIVRKRARDLIDSTASPVAYWIRRRSIFVDRNIRFGDWKDDRVLRLFRSGTGAFSNDLVHERLKVQGPIARLEGYIEHLSVESIAESKRKMRHYNAVAAERVASERRGGACKGVLKALFSLFRGLVLKFGILDGYRGVQLAWFNAYGTFLRYFLAQKIQDQIAFKTETQSAFDRLRDHLSLAFVDHGILRAQYSNSFRLAGGLYRMNQPSPRRLKILKHKYKIKTVVNLRGCNEQLGWYRLEAAACKFLGLKLINTQVFSRGLVGPERLAELKDVILSIELPAIVHCKSGADRAGFFSVLYRHYRLGEPIEVALNELSLMYGHFKGSNTGILDYFFLKFLRQRERRSTLLGWSGERPEVENIKSEFKSKKILEIITDEVLRRE